MNEWDFLKIRQMGTVITGKTPSKNAPSEWGEDYNFVTPSDYRNYFKYARTSSRKLSELGFNSHKKRLIPKNSVLVTCIGSDMGKTVLNSSDCFTNQQINSLIPNNSVIDYDFAYYLFKNNEAVFKSLGSDGTAVPILNKSDFENIDFLIPDLPEQKAIASVLSSLDDKIDLLHRQNKTLESMAETLFRQYFIEEAQEDWEDCNITDLFEVRDGTHASPKQSVSGYPLVTSKHIGSGIIDFNNTYLISEEDYSSINKRSKVEKFDILFSMIGTIGSTHIELSDKINYAIKNVGLLKTSQNHDWKFYTYLWLLSSEGKDFIHATKSGSTQEYISLGSLRSIVFNKPDNNTLRKFNNIAEIHFNKIYKNNKQIITLEKLRDTLLPKLMIGEVRVQYAEEAITSVA
ncbi:restriction endonuclease subunit S [Citrobacter freundii]|uniref:restriction endonuclease subunit S n=1 Tax=Citrobacter freundii complex TaxID=1344959 RepID=UPI001F0928F9|nr:MULTISPECIES: restriction endonuclease subunit S [Citrobacter freundii complex]MCH2699561.1 restriction endonuclease subunit S [Citrobacter portucalensis]MDV2276023.1 restriction endonuclease subunit S [Citrobacter freundii]MEB0856214.1 restriction endonuclease subunit S [Citrobacter freundii]